MFSRIIASMVMSIISSIFAIILVIDAAIGLQLSVSQSDRPPKDVTTVCWAIMFLSGLGQAITTITTSGFACRAVCCRSSSGGRVVYVPRDHQQNIFTINSNRTDGAMALPGIGFSNF